MRRTVKKVLIVLIGLGVWAFVILPIYPWIANSLTNFMEATNMSTITFPVKAYEQVTLTSTTVIDVNTTSTYTVTTWDWVEHPTEIDISGLVWFLLGVVVIGLPILLLASIFRH